MRAFDTPVKIIIFCFYTFNENVTLTETLHLMNSDLVLNDSEFDTVYSFLLTDASFGYFSLLPNLLTGYGWNPGNRIYQWFGEALAKKSKGNPDITFLEVR